MTAFGKLGTIEPEELELSQDGELHEGIRPLETFVCMGYLKDGEKSLPELRWNLFRSKNLESELLPPTRATLLPQIKRTNYICRAGKSYEHTHPVLPALTDSGWMLDKEENIIKPILCVYPPAPKGVIELIKCACKSGKCGSHCSCKKNKLPCTSMCKCRHEGCTNAEKPKDAEEDEMDD